jgi:excisionase family DNA binding protein
VSQARLASQRPAVRHLRRHRVMTLHEAAKLLGIQHDTLRRQIRLGKLKARKVGPIWTVTEREVERYRRESKRDA